MLCSKAFSWCTPDCDLRGARLRCYRFAQDLEQEDAATTGYNKYGCDVIGQDAMYQNERYEAYIFNYQGAELGTVERLGCRQALLAIFPFCILRRRICSATH